MTVIVQPDSFAAWIGVAGVGIGVILSAGVTFARDVIQGRREHRRMLVESSDVLLGACNALMVLAGLQRSAKAEARLPWIEAMCRHAERIQTAAHEIRRYAAPEVGRQAEELANTVFAVLDLPDTSAGIPRVHSAIDEFFAAGRQHGLRPIRRRRRRPEAAKADASPATPG